MGGAPSRDELKRLSGELRQLVAGLDPDGVTPGEAAGLWSELEGIRRLVSGAELVLARRVDESSAAAEAGLRNGAEWIANASGQSLRSGYEQMAASRRLAKLPRLVEALCGGDVSVAQAEAIADAASCDPGAEERLVGLAAQTSLKELGDECARVKAAADPDPEARHERLGRERRLRQFVNQQGAWCLSGRGTVDAGAEFATVLAAIADEVFREACEAGVEESADAYSFDALIEMARRAWQHMHSDGSGPAASGPAAEPDGRGPETPRRPRRRRRKPGVNARHRVIVRIDHAALVRGHIDGDETCDIAGLGPVPVSVARALLGDAALYLVLTKGTAVANVTSLARAPNVAQRIALGWMGLECSRLGCPRTATEIDHRDPFADVRVTEIGNLDGLCDPDHDLKTYQGWALVPGTGKREMVPPDDPRHPGNPTFHKRHKRRQPNAA